MKYYTATEVSKLFMVSRQSINNWIHSGKLATIQGGSGRGKVYLIPESAVEKLKQQRQQELEIKLSGLDKEPV